LPLARIALFIITFGLLYGGIEAVFPSLVPYVPLSLQRFLLPAVVPLAASSKSRLVPHDYTALLGDSYAQGEGDWHRTGNAVLNSPFHSADLLHQAGAGDVISFGRAGAGSLEGLVAAPIGALMYLNALRRFEPLAPPATALLYFYEGNDLNDNLRDLRSRSSGGFDRAKLYDRTYFQQFLKTAVVEPSPLVRDARTITWRDRLLVMRFMGATIGGLIGPGANDGDEGNPIHPPPGQAVNRARVAGAISKLPDLLQGPALELSADEIRQSIWVFRQAAFFMKQQWPSTTFVVVYVPSPLSCYQLDGERVSAQSYEGRGTVFRAEAVDASSDRIAADIRRASEELGVRFVDARPELRKTAAEIFIHGPMDWKHFNRLGYDALVRAIRPAAKGRSWNTTETSVLGS